MGPKKTRKGNEPEKKEDELKLIDKEFYIIQIEELNRKLARLESKCSEMEVENEAVRLNMEKLDEDRGDVISHLRRTLQKKVDEVNELTERIDALQMAKETEGSRYKDKIKNMENDFKQMHEQLSSEIKLLNGKLNSLEEFRAQREDLMAKFERQEQALDDQEKRHDQQLLDLEQSYLVRKERLKEEMEARLLKLSLDFQKATQMRIASTTQSVIRENIAVNNQLNTLVAEWKRINEEMDTLRANNRALLLNEELNLKERKIIERKNIVQGEVIKKLAEEGTKLKSQSEEMDTIRRQLSRTECELAEARRCERLAMENLGLAKQHIHAIAVKHNELKITQNKTQQQAFKLESTLTKASKVVKQVLELSRGFDSDEGAIIRRAELLKILQELLELDATKKEITIHDTISVETIVTIRDPCEKYKTGDLGIVPSRKDSDQSTYSLADHQQDMTWEDEAMNVSKEIVKYIQSLESTIVSAKSIVKELQLLPIESKTRIMKEEVKARRGEFLTVLQNILDISLKHTARPLPLPSLESIIFPEGLVPEELDFPTDVDKLREYEISQEESDCTEDG